MGFVLESFFKFLFYFFNLPLCNAADEIMFC